MPKAGKRFVSIASMLGCALTTGCISLYGFFFRHTKTQFTPILLFVLLNFIWSCGVGQIPWMLISEVFPFRGRGVASGVVAAISYIEAFVFIKTFYSLHHAFSVSGVFAFYTITTLFGTVFLYVFLPETEGKTLHQIESTIENHFKRFKLPKTRSIVIQRERI